MVNEFSGVILAGGSGKRFNGQIKPNIVIEGKTILSHITGIFDELFDEIIIVTNIPDHYKSYSKYRVIEDSIQAKGPLGGIHAALKEIDNQAAFIVAGDMPLLNKDLITRQLNYFRVNKCDILVPKTGPYIEPLHGIYSRKIVDDMEQYLMGDGNFAVRNFIKKADVKYFELSENEVAGKPFTNINSQEDLISSGKHPYD